MTMISSIYIATITPSILKHAMGGLVSFVKTIHLVGQQISKKIFPHKILNILNLLQIYSEAATRGVL